MALRGSIYGLGEEKAYSNSIDKSVHIVSTDSTLDSTELPEEEPELAALLVEQGHTIEPFLLTRFSPGKNLKPIKKAGFKHWKLLISGAVIAGFAGLVGSTLRKTFTGEALLQAWGKVKFQDASWTLPTVEASEGNLSNELQSGKLLVAKALKSRNNRNPPAPGDGGTETLKFLARHLSHGRTDDIIGLDIKLKDRVRLGETEVNPALREYTVTKFLGEGATGIILEVTDKTNGESYAMRLCTIPNIYGDNGAGKFLAHLVGFGGMVQETTSMLQASGTTTLEDTSADRGLAVVSTVAKVDGMPMALPCPSVYVFPHVYLMERLHGDLSGIFTLQNKLPMPAKEYAARRLVLQVLHLQHAGFSHNDLKLENIFMREDGSFLIGDFGSGTTIGERLMRMTGVTPLYAEPELCIATLKPGGGFPIVDAKADMWTLGINLYRIFMDGSLPYKLSANPADDFSKLQRNGTRSAVLNTKLTQGGVPQHWCNIIMLLLEVDRSNRVDAETLSTQFTELMRFH